MSLVATRKAFIDWIRNVTSYDAKHVIWENQNMPRPTKPYITAKLTAFNNMNTSYVAYPNPSGSAAIYSDKEFTLSLVCFGVGLGATDPLITLLNLHISLSSLNPYKILQDACIAFVDTLLGPTDTTVLKSNTMFEERANMDLLMRIPWTSTDAAQGLIETAALQDTTIGVGGITIDVNSITIN